GLPALQRDPVPGQPGLLPDLHAVDRRQLVVPGDVGLVVVDREQTAPFVHQPGQRVGVGGAGHAEVDPVVDAEDVGVAGGGGDLHGAHEHQVRRGGGVEVAALGRGVVVGDGKEIEAGLAGRSVE